MTQETKDIILLLTTKNGFTFYAPLSRALNVKGRTAESHLKSLVRDGCLVMRDHGVHANKFELSRLGLATWHRLKPVTDASPLD